MQSLVRARQFKDVFTVRQEGDHVQQSIRRKDVVDASNSTRVVFCAGPFARRRLNRRRLCLDIHFDYSFFGGGGALICGRDKIETRFRLYVERRSARRRGKERKKERKKELSRALSRRGRSSSSSSSSFGARSSFLLRCRSKKTPKGRGPSFFRTFFCRGNPNKTERKNNMEWKKKTRRLSFCVFFNVSLQFSFHFIIICRDDNNNKNKNKNNYLSTSHALYHNTPKRETTPRLFNTHPSILIIIITTYEDAFPTTTTTTATTTTTTTTKSTSSSSTKSSTTKKANKFFTTKGDGTRRVHPKEQSRHGNDRIRADGTLAIEWNVLGTDRCCADEEDKRNNEQR